MWKDKDTESEAEQPKLLSSILRHASMHTIILFTFRVKVCVTMVTQQNYGFTVHWRSNNSAANAFALCKFRYFVIN